MLFQKCNELFVGRLLKLQRRIYTANKALYRFMCTEWDFKNEKFMAFRELIPPEDLLVTAMQLYFNSLGFQSSFNKNLAIKWVFSGTRTSIRRPCSSIVWKAPRNSYWMSHRKPRGVHASAWRYSLYCIMGSWPSEGSWSPDGSSIDSTTIMLIIINSWIFHKYYYVKYCWKKCQVNWVIRNIRLGRVLNLEL